MEEKIIGPRTSKEKFFSELIDFSYAGFEGIKEATYNLAGKEVKVAACKAPALKFGKSFKDSIN